MATRKTKRSAPAADITYETVAQWRKAFLPRFASEVKADRNREDIEQTAARLARETIAEVRRKTGI